MLILSILGYSLFSGLTGFATGWMSFSFKRRSIASHSPASSGEHRDGDETAPTSGARRRLAVSSAAIRSANAVLPAAIVVVPMWGWRALYWLGVLPALLVLDPDRRERKPTFRARHRGKLKGGLKKHSISCSPVRQYPREMLIASLVYFFYLFTWIGWSAWMPQFLATEKKLGFQIAVSYLSIWMFCRDLRVLDLRLALRCVRPALCDPRLRHPGLHPSRRDWLSRRSAEPVLGGPRREFPHHGELRHRSRIYLRTVPDPDSWYGRRRRLHFRHAAGIACAGDHRLDRDVAFDCRRPAAAGGIVPAARAAVLLFARETTRKELADFVGQRWPDCHRPRSRRAD